MHHNIFEQSENINMRNGLESAALHALLVREKVFSGHLIGSKMKEILGKLFHATLLLYCRWTCKSRTVARGVLGWEVFNILCSPGSMFTSCCRTLRGEVRLLAGGRLPIILVLFDGAHLSLCDHL